MRPKITVPPCRFCSKEFQRTEHLRRHERTHTKDKPYSCRCGRSFSRQDLLARHDRLSHHTDASTQPPSTHAIDGQGPLKITALRDDEFNLTSADVPDAINEAIGHRRTGGLSASAAQPVTLQHTDLSLQSGWEPDRVDNPGLGAFGDDLDFLWGHFDMNSTVMQSSTLNYPVNFLTLPEYNVGADANPGYSTRDVILNGGIHHEEEGGAISRYGSRLPSPLVSESEGLTPAHHQQPRPGSSRPMQLASKRDGPQPGCRPWRISPSDYDLICAAINQTAPVQTRGFNMPTRHALNRYVEGYFSGFHEHLPFLHLPTTYIPAAAPELILAIAAVGAQYRFQGSQARHIAECAEAVISWRLGELYQPSTRLTDSVYSYSLPKAGSKVEAQSGGRRLHTEHPEQSTEPIPADDGAIQLFQSMILIMARGTWNHSSELKKSVPLGMQIAVLLRETGLSEPRVNHTNYKWEEWIGLESHRRTKLVAYCFLNLHSIAYNWSPQIMSHNVQLHLPSSEALWRAETAEAWDQLCREDPVPSINFQEAYAKLFSRPQADEGVMKLSSFGNHVMAHVILQQVFFVRQATPAFEGSETAALPQGTLNALELALNRWQRSWESTEDSSIDPSSPNGPLSFNSTALFRIAYVRMHADLGAHRRLETRDPTKIAQALGKVPRMAHSVHVCRAVLQCIHSLSIPVRIGIEFVSRTQTLSWSIIHSLCDFECASFLSQWLNCVVTKTAEGYTPSDYERRLLHLVQSVLRETDFADEIDAEGDVPRRYKHMAAAVVRICSQTLKGNHVWDVMDVMGSALEMRAEMF